MSISADYKWRTRMCRKWQEEMQQKQKQQPQQPQQPQQQQQQQQLQHQQQPHKQQQQQQDQQLGNRHFKSFVEDPMNLHKLFLPRRTLQLLSHRPDFQRLVKSCFVRVQFGGGHRVAQIQGFGKWRPNNDPTLILRLDSSPRVIAMDQLENNYFEPAELQDFECTWQSYNFELPSNRFVELKHKAITEAKLQSQAQLMSSVRYPPPPRAPVVHRFTRSRSGLVPDYRSMPYVYSNSTSNSMSNRKVVAHSNSGSVSVSVTIPNAASTSNFRSGFEKPSVPSTPQSRKYLVEPMDCYKPYLPKQLAPTATVTSSKLMEPPKHSIASFKKKISINEYRQRFIKKQN